MHMSCSLHHASLASSKSVNQLRHAAAAPRRPGFAVPNATAAATAVWQHWCMFFCSNSPRSHIKNASGQGSVLTRSTSSSTDATSPAGAASSSSGTNTNTSTSSSSSSSGSNPGSSGSSQYSQDPLNLMSDMAQFMSQFSEADLMAAYARAAEAIQGMQQQQQQDNRQDAQQQQQQQPKIPPTAVSFLKTVMLRAQERSVQGSSSSVGDPLEYLHTEGGRGLLWEVLREQFTTEETSLLDSAFGSNWQSFGQQQQQLDMSQLWRFASLQPEDMGKLGNLMDKLNAMNRQMDTLAAQLPKRPQPDNTPSSSSRSSSTSSSSSKAAAAGPQRKAWGATWLNRTAAAKGADSPTGSRGSRGSVLQVYSWTVPLTDADVLQRLQRLLVLSSSSMTQQQQQWGIPPSQQFQMLLRLYQQLVQLEAAQALYISQQQQQPGLDHPQQLLPGVMPLSPVQAESVYATISSELGWLMRRVAADDTTTQSAFWYMHALLDDSWQSTSRSSGSSSGSSDWYGQSEEMIQEVSVQRLESLGLFLAAAANLEPLRAWVNAFVETRPGSSDMTEVQQVLGAVEDDWFIKPHMRQQALAAAQAAAAAAAASPSGSSTSSSTTRASPPGGGAFGLQPHMIDDAGIAQMAVLDSTLLWFLAEMEAAPDPQQVLLKWALHPTIGPKLKGRNWLQQFTLQEPVLSVYNRLRAMNYMTQVS